MPGSEAPRQDLRGCPFDVARKSGGNSVGEWLAEVWRTREILYFLAWRDVKVRYKQAALGIAWAVIQPLGR